MPSLPTTFFAGYDLLAAAEAAPSQGIFIPLTDLAGLSAAEADPATGDGRKVLFEVLKKAIASYNALAAADRPTAFIPTISAPSGVNVTTIRQTYSIAFDLDVSDVDVAD